MSIRDVVGLSGGGLSRSRWAALGAAVAVTAGFGGLGVVRAVESGVKPVTVTVEPTRILDTRVGLGSVGRFVTTVPRDVQVTGMIPIAPSGTAEVVPAGALAVLVNVTVVYPDGAGYLALRPGGSAGVPTTSTVNFTGAGTVEPNGATAALAPDGTVQVFIYTALTGGTADVLIDVVGYTVDHTHDDRYYTEAEVNELVGTPPAGQHGGAGPQYGRLAVLSTNVETVGNVGVSPSITIGVAGNPIISHYDATNQDLRVTHCNDAACASATSTAVDTEGNVGHHASIAIGADGLPIISYYDITNQDLRVTHCNDVACTGDDETSTTVESNGFVGIFSSITIGADGLPVIAHQDGNEDLRITHCNDVACTGGDETSTTVDSVGSVGWSPSITVGVDGFPIISHYESGKGDLRVTHCNDVACTGGDETTTAVDFGGVGKGSSITIGVDGFPIISYLDELNWDLRVTHCNDVACTGGDETSTTVDSAGAVGSESSITIGVDGLPIISHYDNTNHDLRLTRCNDLACSGVGETSTTVDAVGDVGNSSSITISDDGAPIISHHENTNGSLRVTKLRHTSWTPNAWES